MARRQQNNGNGGNELTGVELVKAQTAKVRTMFGQVNDQITHALAKQLDPQQFVRTCLTAYQRGSDDMFKADPRSFIAACIEAAQLGLKPDGVLQEAYLIPRYDKTAGCVLVSLQIGYKGYMRLARRSQEISELLAEVVYENDEFDVQYGTDRKIHHKPWFALGKDDSGSVIAAYATTRLVRDGSVQFKAISRKEIDAARKIGKTDKFWGPFFDAMARKTAMLQLCKWLPLKGDIQRAVARDDIRSAGGLDDELRHVIETIGRERAPQTVEQLIPEDPTVEQLPPAPADGAQEPG